MEPSYLPTERRYPDYQYQNCLKKILEHGRYTKNPKQSHGRYTHLSLPPMEFNLRNGFPIITERRISFWKTPIAELLAFIHGVRTGEELEKWGVNWWSKQWVTPEKCADFGLPPGDLGPGSYGAAFHDFPHFEWESVENHPDSGRYVPKPFNQFENVIKEIIEFPGLSTHKITSWIPQYCIQHSGLKRKVVVAPCHGDIQITILDNKLSLRMDQRSGDFPIGVPSNMIQYAALTVMIGHVTGFEPETYIHCVRDAQIYENQIESARNILERKPLLFGTFHLTEEGKKIRNLFDFRPDHFEVRGYESHPAIRDISVTT